MFFDQLGSDYTNNDTINDGVTIGAAGFRLTNSDSGRIYGGVTFTVAGSTLINQLGGIIRPLAGSPAGSPVITGSDGADIVVNRGLLDGSIDLGSGDDLFVHGSTASGTFQINLGAGDDILQTDGGYLFDAAGGAGRDRFEIQSTRFEAIAVSGFEDLVVSGGGWFSGLSGFSTITYGAGATIELEYSRNPLATVQMAGGSFQLGLDSTLLGLIGSDAREEVRISGGARFEGNVDLGAGSDLFGTAAATMSQQAGSPLGGTLSGGAGWDVLALGVLDATPNVVEHYDVDLAKVSGFETLTFDNYLLPMPTQGWISDIAISGARGFSEIILGDYGQYRISMSILPDAIVEMGDRSDLTIDAGVIIRGVDNARLGTDIAQGDDQLSVSLTNSGQILGDVRFGIGDDYYDGRSGTLGGTVYGNAGNDTLLGGTGSDRMAGGFGADLLSGGSGVDVLTGGEGSDVFRDTLAGLNGDTITDFAAGDRIVISDAELASFTFSLNGSALTFGGATLTLSNVPAGRFVTTAAAGGGVQITVRPATRDDFDGDGRSDVLWRHDSGALTDWLGRQGGVLVANNANAIGQVDSSWIAVGTGDFNGDGRADVLWRHSSGLLTDWLGQANGGFTANNGKALQSVDNSWHVAGTGDFNGDGRDDILWRRDAGTISEWLGQADGGFASNHARAGAEVATSWHVAATGDFNGDGRADILWRNDSGVLTDWLGQRDGSFVVNNANALQNVDNSWHVVGTGDFNGDGRADILWRHDSGALSDWLGQENGGFIPNNANSFSQVERSWHVAGIGDYNGDGRDDVLWRHDSGLVTQWLGAANGGFTSNDANVWHPVLASWHVQSPDVSLI